MGSGFSAGKIRWNKKFLAVSIKLEILVHV